VVVCGISIFVSNEKNMKHYSGSDLVRNFIVFSVLCFFVWMGGMIIWETISFFISDIHTLQEKKTAVVLLVVLFFVVLVGLTPLKNEDDLIEH
jgi:divalent metal cation (Fe/Co/Zn/Cd) transporter